MVRADKNDLNADELIKEDLGFVAEDTQSSKEKGLTHEDVVSNSILFFAAGYDTTATTLAFLCYSLAMNRDVQQKLYEEINSKVGQKDNISYDDLNQLVYLEWCINESLRLYPIATGLLREAVQSTEVSGIPIPKGLGILIPVFQLHRDPDVYPEPEKFIPDRFSPESKASRDPYSYLPFGMGPRNCVGMRLALMEIKVAMVKLLQKCSITTCEETQILLQFKSIGVFQPTKPIALKLELR